MRSSWSSRPGRLARAAVAAVAVLGLAATAACGATGAPAGGPAGGDAAGSGLRIAVVPGSTGYFYWGTMRAGAEQAGQDLGVEILWNGTSTQTDVTGQVNILQNFITQQVDGIAFAANDTNALQTVVDSANAAQIPIVSADSGIDPQRIPLIATDNLRAAGDAARYLAEQVGGTGKVALLPFLATALTSQQRVQGFSDGLAEFPGMEVVATQFTQGDVNTAQTVMSDILTAHPDLTAVFAANEPGVIGAVQAIESRGLTGQVRVIGFDNAPDEVTALRAGSVDALVVQDPFRIGYESVQLLVDLANGGTAPDSVDTGATVVTQDNMDDPEVVRLLDPPVVQ